jgi:hypothetical protein
MTLKDRLVTITLAVAATCGVIDRDANQPRELEVDRLIVRQELIVSDTGLPWEKGYEAHQIPRGIYARSVGHGTGGLWVRSRLIKGEIDDPFDDRFHAIESDGSIRRAPGHISWNVWLDGAWRQVAIVQGEGLEYNETPREEWNGSNHPGRLRFQSFRPHHPEPLTDAIIGQGRMSVGGGGYGGEGLPYPTEVLQLWGGSIVTHPVPIPDPPTVVKDDATGGHQYSLIAVGPQGTRSSPSGPVTALGLATLSWEGVFGADSYFVLRDNTVVAGPLRIEGATKQWTDPGTGR